MSEQHKPWRVLSGDWDSDGNVRYTLDGIQTIGMSDVRLIEAAPELLEAHEPEGMGADFLDWIADRLVHIHKDQEGADFIVCLRRRADKARAAIAKATGAP